MPVQYLLSQRTFSDHCLPCCNCGYQDSCHWFSSRIVWHSRLLFDELVKIADYLQARFIFARICQGHSFLSRDFLFLCSRLFLLFCFDNSRSKLFMISILAGFDYFWCCLLSDFLSIMACPIRLLCVVRLRLVRNFLIPVLQSFCCF